MAQSTGYFVQIRMFSHFNNTICVVTVSVVIIHITQVLEVKNMSVYITGDPHGSSARIAVFCSERNLSKDDIIVLLGDVGANYFLDHRDLPIKEALNALGPEVLCIHGNHEARPWHMVGCATKVWNGGLVYYQKEFPNILYAKDGEIYRLEGLNCMAIGGAHSVDRAIREARGWQWFSDEQPSAEIKAYVEEQLSNHPVDIISRIHAQRSIRPLNVLFPELISAVSIPEQRSGWT